MQAGQCLREIRKTYKISQREVERLLNLPGAAVSKIEHGTRQLSADDVRILATALGITPNQFYGIDVLPPPPPRMKQQMVERIVKQVREAMDDLSNAFAI